MASQSDAGKQRIRLRLREIASATSPPPRRRQRMFPGRSSDSQAQPTCRTSQATSPVSFWLSYLLTAAGQFRSLTGFPFHPLCRGTEEFDHYILSVCELQSHPLRSLCRSGPKNGTPSPGSIRPSGRRLEREFATRRPCATACAAGHPNETNSLCENLMNAGRWIEPHDPSCSAEYRSKRR